MQKLSKVLPMLLAATGFALAQTPVRQQPAAPGGRGGAAPGRGGPAAPIRKQVLVFGMAKGFHHDSISNAMATVWKLGKESGVWDTELRTDTDVFRKPEGGPGSGFRPLNLRNFDAVVWASATGEADLNDQQKADLLSFVHDDGKGFVGIHAALDANYKWPEYAEMIGGWFDGHPWNTFDAPIVVEDPNFPATRHFARAFMARDEIYQAKNWSRDKVNVLMRLDDTRLDYTGKNNARKDRDFAIAWSKMYGQGRVFYSTLGHTNEAWDDPDIQKMYLEAIKWVLRRTEGSTAPHAR
jgi:type 1 glutamine amidotransferase